MSIKWAIGAVIAVFAVTLALPSIASAHHPVYSEDISCDDGTFSASLSYVGGPGNRILVLRVEGDQYDGNSNDFDDTLAGGDPDGSLSASHLDEGSGDGNFNFSQSRDRWESDGAGNRNNFFVLEGNYDDVDAADTGAGDDDGDIDFEVWMYGANSDGDLDDTSIPDGSNPTEDASPGESGNTLQRSISTNDFWSECGLEICLDGETGVEVLSFQNGDTEDCDPAQICIDGDFVGGTEFEINQLNSTSDCGPVRLCVEGQSITVTEFQAENIDGDPGSCVPSEEPPPPPPTTEDDPEEPVEEVQEAVAEVSPAVEEVAALPAAGQGNLGGVSYTWIAIFGLAVIGFGGATTLTARQRK